MLKTLIQKELRAILLSPKFPATFAICSLLIILSVLIGIREYRTSVKQYETGRQLTDQLMREQTNWSSVHNKAFRSPDPMQIFVSGVTFDLGRWSFIDNDNNSRLQNSVYSEDPIFAVFRFMDFSFIVLIVLSLLAIVFTYDAVCGERESGTLRLVFSHAIPRANYLIAKCTGAWLGLIVPMLIPILISLLLLQIFSVPFTGTDWLRLILLMAVSLLFLTFFVVFGVLMSALTKRSSISFLLSLMGWVLFVFIIPRMGILAASQIVPVPSVAEIEGQKETYAKDKWLQYNEGMNNRMESQARHNGQSDSLSDKDMWARIQAEDSLRKDVSSSIEAYETKLLDDQRRAQTTQQSLGFSLCLFSPASAFQLAGMTLSNTDIGLKQRYEETMNRYRNDFQAYVEKKQVDQPGTSRFTIQIDSKSGFKMNVPNSQQELDLSDLPRFDPPGWLAGAALGKVAIDVGLLICLIFAAFAGSWVAFMRYDLR